jgi:hypothetical protein
MMGLLKGAGKTPLGWEELTLITGGADEAHFPETVLLAWKGSKNGKVVGSALDTLTARGFRAVNVNATAFYVGWQGSRPENWTITDMYYDIAAELPPAQRSLVLGGEVAVWTDNYDPFGFGQHCGVSSAPHLNPAGRLYPRSEDAAFASSTLAIMFPGAVVAADAWWRFDPSLDVSGDAYTARLAQANAKLRAAGVDGCPSDCMLRTDLHGGCNQTARCGVPY